MSKKALPLATRSSVELLPLGTAIEFHHRAAPARHQRAWEPREGLLSNEIPRGWKLKDGLYKDEQIPEGMGEGIDGDNFIGPKAEYVVIRTKEDPTYLGNTEDKSYNLKDAFFNWPRAHNGHSWYKDDDKHRYNKTIFVWPANGSGVIMGLIKRGIGISSASHYYRDYEGYGDVDQGYLQTDMYIDLYVVKQRYEGTDYILCPLWGVKEVRND